MTKCALGISLEKFLGFMIHPYRIDTKPDKVKTIINMKPPCFIKEVK